MTRCILGIDTSCYTTSIAILDESGCLLADKRRLLQVKDNGIGLSQSEMVFQHMRFLPEVFTQAFSGIDDPQIIKIGVSSCPRQLPDSYMPAFLTGAGYAQVLATAMQIPLYKISHQENHILAGLWSAAGPTDENFLALHISGGTTDLLHVNFRQHNVMYLQQLGTGIDINAGQLIDRIGVAMGIKFPAGPGLEILAKSANGQEISLPISVKEMNISFSGPFSHAMRLLNKNVDHAQLALGVQNCIAKSILKIIVRAIEVTSSNSLLIVGGVASNQYIRNYLSENLSGKVGIFFPKSEYSSDNSVGAAYNALLH